MRIAAVEAMIGRGHLTPLGKTNAETTENETQRGESAAMGEAVDDRERLPEIHRAVTGLGPETDGQRRFPLRD
jgi:hypothetical protein